MKKKLGSIRTVAPAPTSGGRSRAAPQKKKKKLGTVVRSEGVRPSGSVQSCPENCPGEYVEGCWIHSPWCRWASVLWTSHGKTAQDWKCPFDCPPLELPSGWTHPHDCKFWDRTGRTPFDHNAP